MIYICIPAYDEERTAGIVLWKIRKVMADFQRDYQVLFLDDASTDSTFEVVEPYGRVLPLTIIRNERREGQAASLDRLFREAIRRCDYPRRDVVVTLQADFTDEPLAIPTLVKRIEGGADLVVAAQDPDGTSLPRSVRWVRRGLPWLERRHEFPEGITDPLSRLRAYRVGLLKRAYKENGDEPLLSRDGWAGSLELLLTVAPHTRRIEEIPSEVRYDRHLRPSRVSLWHVARDYIGLLRRR